MKRRFRWWLARQIIGQKDWQRSFRGWVEEGYSLAQRNQDLPWWPKRYG